MREPIATFELPYSHGLVLLRDSKASPVLKEDWTEESHDLGVAVSTSSAALTVEDCLRVHVRFFRGLEGCLASANATTRTFKLHVASRRLVVHEILDDRSETELPSLLLNEEEFPEKEVYLVKTVKVLGEELRAMDLHLLTPSEHQKAAETLPSVIEKNFPEAGDLSIRRAPKVSASDRMTPLQRRLDWLLRKFGM